MYGYVNVDTENATEHEQGWMLMTKATIDHPLKNRVPVNEQEWGSGGHEH